MVDSNHRERVEETRDALEWTLEAEELAGAVLLVFGNKQDLSGAMSYRELEEQLELRQLRGRQWRLQLCSVLTLNGLSEGVEWLSRVLTRRANCL
jgi:signal recognition particle receptor subunit beta